MSGEIEEKPSIDRRYFLVACGMALAWLTPFGKAQASGEPQIVFAEPSCGQGEAAKKRVLIAYASRCGSTGSIAEAMAEALCAKGASVDVLLIQNVKDLSAYQAVIIGSAIRRSAWLSEAASFVKNHQDALSRTPTAYFVTCLTMKEDSPETRARAQAFLDPVRKSAPGVVPVGVGLFGGVVDFGKLSFMNRTMLEAKGIEEGDYRNLPAVKAWTHGLAPALLAGRPQG